MECTRNCAKIKTKMTADIKGEFFIFLIIFYGNELVHSPKSKLFEVYFLYEETSFSLNEKNKLEREFSR
jgi:hypothetical protein